MGDWDQFEWENGNVFIAKFGNVFGMEVSHRFPESNN